MMESNIEKEKPIYIDQSILDFSEILIYELHYEWMIPIWVKKNLHVSNEKSIDGKIITKFAAATPDTCASFISKDKYENKNKEFKKDEGVKTSP